MSDIDNIINESTEVNRWQYWILPIWMIIRHPYRPKFWYIQATVKLSDDETGKVFERHYYLKEIDNV